LKWQTVDIDAGFKMQDSRCRIQDAGFRIQGYKDTRIQGYKDTRIQGFKDSRIQGFKDSRIQGFKDSRIQGFKDSRIQGFKDSRIQGFKDSGCRMQDAGCRMQGAGFRIQGFRAPIDQSNGGPTACPDLSGKFGKTLPREIGVLDSRVAEIHGAKWQQVTWKPGASSNRLVSEQYKKIKKPAEV
jgi:hypothetical protein